MVHCGLYNLFRNNKASTIKNVLDSNEIILKQLNDTVDLAELNYKKNNNTANMLKCINAVNMRNKFLNTIKNGYTQMNNTDEIDLT